MFKSNGKYWVKNTDPYQPTQLKHKTLKIILALMWVSSTFMLLLCDQWMVTKDQSLVTRTKYQHHRVNITTSQHQLSTTICITSQIWLMKILKSILCLTVAQNMQKIFVIICRNNSMIQLCKSHYYKVVTIVSCGLSKWSIWFWCVNFLDWKQNIRFEILENSCCLTCHERVKI